MSSITRPPRAGIDVSYRQGNERIARFLSFFPGPGVLGFIGSLLVAVTSYLAGVIRFRNSLADDLNLSYLTFGHGYLASNFVFVLGLSLLIIAWLKLGRMTVIDARPSIDKRRRAIDRCLFVWLFPLLFSAPIMSRDSYSYLMQGAMVREASTPTKREPSLIQAPISARFPRCGETRRLLTDRCTCGSGKELPALLAAMSRPDWCATESCQWRGSW